LTVSISFKFGRNIVQIIQEYFTYYHLLHWLILSIYCVYILFQTTPFIDYPTDEAYYYLPSIQWLIQYPVVIGLGNIALPYTYNSSWFLLDAFYGFFFTGLHCFNDLNGYVAICFFIFCLEGVKNIQQNTYQITDYFKIGTLIIALFYFKNFILTITVDFGVIIISYILLILFLEWIIKPTIIRIFLICILSAFAFTIKISALPLSGFFIYFVSYLWMNKRRVSSFNISAICLILLLLYFIHNVITTGYLFNPLRFFDVFNVDWKVVPHTVIGQGHILKPFTENKVFNGINNTYISTLDWYYLHFFVYTSLPSKLFHCLLFGSIISIYFLYQSIRRDLDLMQRKALLFLFSIVYTGMAMWLFLLPSWDCAGLKIAAVFLFFLGLSHWVLFCVWIEKYHTRLFNNLGNYTSILVAFIAIAHWIHIQKPLDTFSMSWVKPQDFHIPGNIQTQKIKNILFYIKSPNDRHECWGSQQPCVQAETSFFELRGNSIKAGFKPSKVPNLMIKYVNDK
jgi:hypothetical protein